MLKGQLWATSDINLVNQALIQGVKVIYLGDSISLPQEYKDKFVVATSFVPDYQTMSLMVDGNENGFIQMYISSLGSKAATEMMSAILACLYRGITVIFYLPPEASGLNYVGYLLEYIQMNYGITTQTKTTQYSFNPQFSGVVSELLYLNDLINSQEFLVNSTSLDDFTLKKLVKEYHPLVKNPKDINDIVKWFSDYKDALLQSDKPLINGIQYAGEDSDYGCY